MPYRAVPGPPALRSLLVLLALIAACGGDDAPERPPGPWLVGEQIAFEGDPVQATHFAFLPGGQELLLALKEGRLLHYRLGGEQAELLGEVAIPEVWSDNDCGLQAVELDPGFADNGLLYAAGCIRRTANRIWRLSWNAADYDAITESIVTVLTVEEPDAPRPFHNAGSITFDDQGLMLAPFGDKVVKGNGQDIATEAGALLRLEPSREPDGEGHSAPPDNPFAMDPQASELIYAHGLRAPWRSFRDRHGRVWISDVGSDAVEEINVVTQPGQNFGWATHEGPCPDACDELTQPVLSWEHDDDHPYILDDPYSQGTDKRAGWLGVMYEASEADPYGGVLDDRLLFGEYCVGWMRLLGVDDALQVVEDRPIGHLETVVGVRQHDDGHLYALTFGTCGSVVEDPPPALLHRLVLDPQ